MFPPGLCVFGVVTFFWHPGMNNVYVSRSGEHLQETVYHRRYSLSDANLNRVSLASRVARMHLDFLIYEPAGTTSTLLGQDR